MTLTWDWGIFAGIVFVGFFVGYLLWPFAWPLRKVHHEVSPPLEIVGIVAIVTVLAFVVFLAVFRFIIYGSAELQASVLLISFIISCLWGLGFKKLTTMGQ